VECDFHVDWDSDRILTYKDRWDANIYQYNQQAVSSAKGAFHVSKSWVEAEATGKVIWSAIETLIILLVLAFFGMVLFTWSVALSLFVVGATLAVISGLSFFMVVIMQWEIGLIEVIALVYFIGYAVTYSLHITHKYAHLEEHSPMDTDDHSTKMVSKADGSHGTALGAGVGSLHDEPETRSRSEIRFARTIFAIQSMGAATLGSAATTAGAAMFLCFSTLTIFQRLGSMCLIVTLLSIYIALGPLPAFLICCGPTKPGEGGSKWLARCCRCCSVCGCGGFTDGLLSRMGIETHGHDDSAGPSGSSPLALPPNVNYDGSPRGKGLGKGSSPHSHLSQVPREMYPASHGYAMQGHPQARPNGPSQGSRFSPRRE